MLDPLSELSPVARASILRSVKAAWEEVSNEDKMGYLAAGGLEFCLAAGIPKDELEPLLKQMGNVKSQLFCQMRGSPARNFKIVR